MVVPADLEGGLDNGVPAKAQGDRLETFHFLERTAAGYSVPPRSVKGAGHKICLFYADERSGLLANCVPEMCKSGKRP